MYRVLIADDENIVIESLRFIINSKFEDMCEIETAKTGRAVIELAETFRPDIAFMDIHMPGINGIDAMKEIRKQNDAVIFIVMTAFDKFDYARESIGIGVLEYLSKPASRDSIESVLSKAMRIIDKRREIRSRDLTIKEKLETVIPFIERGLVYSMLVNEDGGESVGKYRELLGINDDYAYVLVAEARQGARQEDTNLVGSGVRLEDHYELVKEKISDELYAIVGPVMTNKIIAIVPCNKASLSYDERTMLVDRVRSMVHKLEKEVNTDIRIGIGNIKRFNNIYESYHEASAVLKVAIGTVIHADDVKLGCSYEDDYPMDTEVKIFEAIEKGDDVTAASESLFYWNWMMNNYADKTDDIRIKIIDFVLWAERIAYSKSNIMYRFSSRSGYLSYICGTNDMLQLKKWFLDKMTEAARQVSRVMEETKKTPVENAISYINDNYANDISLEEVSLHIGISTYYFSKLFKAETGTNFLEYLTDLRINKAKKMLAVGVESVKDIGAKVGYPDPNYFSRIFKKNVGVSPSEYKGI